MKHLLLAFALSGEGCYLHPWQKTLIFSSVLLLQKTLGEISCFKFFPSNHNHHIFAISPEEWIDIGEVEVPQKKFPYFSPSKYSSSFLESKLIFKIWENDLKPLLLKKSKMSCYVFKLSF